MRSQNKNEETYAMTLTRRICAARFLVLCPPALLPVHSAVPN
jgi:hypothetical protein